MKTTRFNLVVLTVATFALAAGAEEDNATNRLSFSARFGFNISARFKNFNSITLAPIAAPTSARRTPSQPGRPNGDPYNYDDGYMLSDISDNYGGQTWYWGYDNSANVADGGQVAGNTVLLSRSTPLNSTLSGSALDSSQKIDPTCGAELVYSRQLGFKERWRWGLEAAVNFQPIDFRNTSFHSVNLNRSRVTDAYPFTPGTTPPGATPADPYQGSYEGPSFVLDDTPTRTTTLVPAGVATVASKHRFDSDLWGLRLGPYLEFPLNERLRLSLSGGLAAGLLLGDASWTETVTLPVAGAASRSDRGDCNDLLWGGYVGATAAWDFSERWSAVAGVQYQSLGIYKHRIADRQVELDFRNPLFVTLGIGYTF